MTALDNKEEVIRRTKEIFVKQHNIYSDNSETFNRFYKMISDLSYFHLNESDIRGKHILDAGCGNIGYFPIAMLNMGASKVTCVDMGNMWKPKLIASLESRDTDLTKIDFVEINSCQLPIKTESFDLVFCNGLFINLFDTRDINELFDELARVTKFGGYLYTLLGNPGGILEKKIFPAVREYYEENKEFKELIDNMSDIDIDQTLKLMNEIQLKFNLKTFDTILFKSLFDIEYLSYLQAIIRVPKRHIMFLDEKWAESKFLENGFDPPKRCKRFVLRKNIRQFFAPLQYDNSTKVSKILFGPGNLEYIARKIKENT